MTQPIHRQGWVGHQNKGAAEQVLVVAAHPDDEVLGCGGTIVRHVAAGDEVHIAILGEGITSRQAHRDPEEASTELEQLRQQAQRVAELLGAATIDLCGFPDNRFDTVPLLDLVKAVEQTITRVAPRMVYTHHAGDLNIDHRITFEAVLTACRPTPGQCVRTIYSFEVPSSTEWGSPTASNAFIPTVYVDVSEALDKKLEAMAVYDNEVPDYPHPRSIRAIELFARKNGLEVGLEAAERFCLIRSIS